MTPWSSGHEIDLRLQVLDGDGDPIDQHESLGLQSPALLVQVVHGQVTPRPHKALTTDSDGYLYWNDFGGFTGKTYTVWVGFDL